MERTYLFEHIPKCAGTTLTTILGKQYQSSRILTIQTDLRKIQVERYKSLVDKDKLQYELILGHRVYQLKQHIPGETVCFTFLRDPIRRVISYYQYISNQPGHRLYSHLAKGKMDLKEFLNSEISHEAENYMTRVFSGMSFKKCTKEPDKALNLAIDNLEQDFSHLGLVEQFDLSLVMLKRKLNWSREPFYYKKNVSRTRKGPVSQTGEQALEIIRERNKLDMQLYEYAVGRFSEEIASQEKALAIEVAEFKKRNLRYQTKKRPQKFLSEVFMQGKNLFKK